MHAEGSPGFTLVEVLVATAVLSVLLVVLLGIVNQTAATWRYSTSKVEQFQGARNSFESITRQLSQATLNTYWDYEYSGEGGQEVPVKYIRQSDLRFVSGSARTLTASSDPPRPGHGIFFQAPLGLVSEPDFRGLGNLLNTWGYFVEFNSDSTSQPPFIRQLNSPLSERYRFRLLELMQPSDHLTIYSLTSGNLSYNERDWIKTALLAEKPPVHVLAENVIALVFLPKLSAGEDATETRLAPSYSYDSTESKPDPAINPKNQLPPLVQVTLVAIDEPSAARLANGSILPDLGLEELFQTEDPASAARFSDDLEVLQNTLATKRLSYRVFTTHVSIRAAKWSRD